MRIDLNKPIQADAGDILRIRCSFKVEDLSQARVEVFSAVGDYELSPHIPLKHLGALFDGKPAMLQPTRVVLHSKRTDYEFVLTVEEDNSRFVLKQEVDTIKDKQAKVRIQRYGKTRQRIQRFLRNFFRRFGLRTYAHLRQE